MNNLNTSIQENNLNSMLIKESYEIDDYTNILLEEIMNSDNINNNNINNDTIYKNKYLKYKFKYFKLKNKI